ncbi:MAG: RNA polymerase sigma-70 factor [Marinifilaceae bacterium]
MSVANPFAFNFDRIFHSHYKSLCLYAYRIVNNLELAEDIVQDVFIKLMESRTVFNDEKHLKNYLFITVRNSSFNALQHIEVVSKAHERIAENWQDNVDDNERLLVELLDMLRIEIGKLPESCKQILLMAYVDGATNMEIAQKLNISVNTVRAQKMRGKELLRQRVSTISMNMLFLLTRNRIKN